MKLVHRQKFCFVLYFFDVNEAQDKCLAILIYADFRLHAYYAILSFRINEVCPCFDQATHIKSFYCKI